MRCKIHYASCRIKGAKDKFPQSKSNASHVVVASVMSTHSAYTRMPTVATLKIYEY